MSRMVMVLSGADRLRLADGSTHPTGFWAEEVVATLKVLRAAGAHVDLATPGGVRPTVDALSLDERGGVSEADAREFRAHLEEIADEPAAPLPLSGVRASAYDAIHLPGGHAPLADLAQDADLGRLLTEADAQGRIVAALCHGVAGLLSAHGPDGGFAFAGRALTSFTDEEERQGGLGDRTPYFLESRLRERGAVLRPGAAWSSTVVRDGNLITGQNPQSSTATAEAVLKAPAER
ncbi:type 1 glutamine amidotransferase domain-containing protein [Streptomyces echinoruber]|nr:type 1 glutamine amidotransferase domain-containing protein [Streptomyces echinoruber]